MQPIRRYDMDAAILCSLIFLLILDAIGLDVRFEKGVGPIVETVDNEADLQRTPIEQGCAEICRQSMKPSDRVRIQPGR